MVCENYVRPPRVYQYLQGDEVTAKARSKKERKEQRRKKRKKKKRREVAEEA